MGIVAVRTSLGKIFSLIYYTNSRSSFKTQRRLMIFAASNYYNISLYIHEYKEELDSAALG